jgi:type I site-specific restriction endonuclease
VRKVGKLLNSLVFMPELPLSERDVCSQRINPALQESGWDFATQVREEYTLTAGRIMVRGNAASREQGRRADYVLFHKPNIPLAVIEAKGPSHSVGDGMQQGLAYAESLDVPYVFSTNGTAFLFHDRTAQSGTVEREIPMNEFPSPEAIWDAYRSWKGIEEEHTSLVAQDYHSDNSGKEPRYYQVNAINRTVEAIAKGKNRALLVMATGTGKTYVSFQIIWRLWKAGLKKRILFLAASIYLQSWLASSYVYGSIEDNASGTTNQIELGTMWAKEYLTPIPPLAEQHRIVAKVDELMALCDQLEARLTTAQDLNQQLTQAILAQTA